MQNLRSEDDSKGLDKQVHLFKVRRDAEIEGPERLRLNENMLKLWAALQVQAGQLQAGCEGR